MSDLVLLLAADIDIQSAFEFYESYQAGQGEVFMQHLDLALGRLRSFPEIAPEFQPPFRRLLVHGFPFGIFYAVEGKRTVVFGVLDLRQDPKVILRRLTPQ